MKSFNTNHEIYVKLTERGQQLVLEHKRKLNEDIGKEIVEVTPYPVDENGLSKIQLWHFMNLFGKEFYNGQMHQVIKPNEIYINEKDLQDYDPTGPYATWLGGTRHETVLFMREDCFKYVATMLKAVGLDEDVVDAMRGSNGMYRTMTWVGSPYECIQTYGLIPAGAFVFKTRTKNMCKPERYYHDNLPDCYMCGFTGRDIYDVLDVAEWSAIGLWDKLVYNPSINAFLKRSSK